VLKYDKSKEKCLSKYNELYRKYSGSIIYIAVTDDSGEQNIGTGFHVGDGLFVTARHVVENKEIIEIATTANSVHISENDDENSKYTVEPRKLNICEGPFFHPDRNVDVAIFKVENHDLFMSSIQLSDLRKTLMKETDYILNNVLVLGYPPVPITIYPALISTKAEINSMISLRNSSYYHFIISSLARGGFSGGPVLDEEGILLGIVTESLVKNEVPSELGYMNILCTDAINSCINKYYKLDTETNGWAYDKAYFKRFCFIPTNIAELNPHRVISTIEIYDPDPDVVIELINIEPELIELVFSEINKKMKCDEVEEYGNSKNKLLVPRVNFTNEQIVNAVMFGVEVMKNYGYELLTDVE